MADWWKALLPDYSVPAFGGGAAGSAAGYILSAVVGMALIGGLILLISKLVMKARKNESADAEKHE
jgi:cobalt/nickel transport system permease protein